MQGTEDRGQRTEVRGQMIQRPYLYLSSVGRSRSSDSERLRDLRKFRPLCLNSGRELRRPQDSDDLAGGGKPRRNGGVKYIGNIGRNALALHSTRRAGRISQRGFPSPIRGSPPARQWRSAEQWEGARGLLRRARSRCPL